jgi:hypothetical protein
MTEKLTAERAMQAQLDRLAANELPDNERRSLLAWLDEDASRWRACALAFLEAQCWEAVTADWPARVSAAPKPAPAATAPPAKSDWRSALSLAAAALLMFAAGHLSARLWRSAPNKPVELAAPAAAPDRSGPLLASVPVRANLGPHVSARLQIPVTPVAGDAPPRAAISDYERKQWEKRGFEVREELRSLPAELPDGTRVLVPVNKLQLKLKQSPVS